MIFVLSGAPGAHARGGEKAHPRTQTVAQHRLEKGQLDGRACLLLNESASNAAKFIYHPAAPLALVKRTFVPDPISVTRLPRSPSRQRYETIDGEREKGETMQKNNVT
jgi:hypothetical protein